MVQLLQLCLQRDVGTSIADREKIMRTLHWTVRDLELLPDDGNQYEIVDGELYVSRQADWEHQFVSGEIFSVLRIWSRQTGMGVANLAPGIVFSDDSNVIPDVVWISHERLQTALQADRKLHTTPELVVEVLSPGAENERRDREVKLKLYSRRNAKEYWIVNWRERTLEVYRRQDGVLELYKTLNEDDRVESPLLPEFGCRVGEFFPATR